MELSFAEMIVIGVIAFLVLGPEELVKRAQQVGQFMAKTRTSLNNFKVMTQEELLRRSKLDEIKKNLELPDLNQMIAGPGKPSSTTLNSEPLQRDLSHVDGAGAAAFSQTPGSVTNNDEGVTDEQIEQKLLSISRKD